MADVNLKPLADRVVVEPLEEDEVTASGIVLPETAKEKPQKGTVLAVGPGRKDEKGNLILLLEKGLKLLIQPFLGPERFGVFRGIVAGSEEGLDQVKNKSCQSRLKPEKALGFFRRKSLRNALDLFA